MRIPISIKMTLMTLAILLAATLPIAIKSTEKFTNESLAREAMINLNFAESKAKEVDYILQGLIDKLKITSMIIYKKTAESQNVNMDDIDFNFTRDANIVSLDVYNVTDGKIELLQRKVKTDFLDRQKLPANFFEQARKKQNFPFREVTKGDSGKIQIKLNYTNSTSPLLSIGIPLVKFNGRVTHIAIGDYDLSVLQQIFSESTERTLFLVDKNGILMSHPDENLLTSLLNYNNHPVVAKAMNNPLPKQQISFLDPQNQEKLIGGYAKTSLGPIVVSQLPEKIIAEPALDVQRDAFFITSLVLSGAIFFVFLFSMSLTRPIEILADLIPNVAKGQFNINAQDKVKSMDEVGDLAKSFDFMTLGLKERDKMKNLFNKFHGSKIAEDLLKKDIRLGGSTKDVTVFFSDLRGFTAMSEKNSPEEVVKMLNEYFSEMVGIINRNNGVVDKFIGDAIMAVWGAPQSSAQDPVHAVKAALEMRLAIAKLNDKRMSRQQPPILVGIGLHSGKVISGTIGSNERMEYTVIGDTVNTASRIENSTKAFGMDLLISEETAAKVKEHYWLEHAGNAEVKGKSIPMKLFRVRGYRDEKGQMIEVKTPYSEYKSEKNEKSKAA